MSNARGQWSSVFKLWGECIIQELQDRTRRGSSCKVIPLLEELHSPCEDAKKSGQ